MMVDNSQTFTADVGAPDVSSRKLKATNARMEHENPDDYLWRLLQGGKLAGLHFRRNQLIEGYVAPFYCRLSGLVVEVDIERCDEGKPCKERERVFTRRGLRTIRIRGEALLSNPASALQTIRRAAEAPKSRLTRAARPTLPGAEA
ncbi:MAG: DUF559 domain-containing protein [Capsulimonadaceae bacterium]|nr:DUF559 domain-containing protein [Capsulimonadaceae bacterium]